MIVCLGLAGCAATVASGATAPGDPVRGADDPSAGLQTALCTARVSIPAFDSGAACYASQAALLAGTEITIVHPCGGGRGEVTSVDGQSMDAFRAEVRDRRGEMRDQVVVRENELTLTMRSSPYIVYGCKTDVSERLVARLDTGESTYTYAEEWARCHQERCGPLHLVDGVVTVRGETPPAAQRGREGRERVNSQ